MKNLMIGAKTAVKQCMNVKPGEKVLIITDEKMPKELSEALKNAVRGVGAQRILKSMEPLKMN